MTPAPASAGSVGERLTREVKLAQAMRGAAWGGSIEDAAPMSFTASSPMSMLTMGSAKAASQTYNAGALFTNNATAISKG